MRPAARLLANVKAARYLEPYAPTGLTGLFTHPTPRSTLIYLYSSTLDKLKSFPESSVYRQSTESLTSHRLKIVQSIKPDGYEAWSEKVKKQIAENPKAFPQPENGKIDPDSRHVQIEIGGQKFVSSSNVEDVDEDVDEWDKEEDAGAEVENASPSENTLARRAQRRAPPDVTPNRIKWDPEPALSAEKVSDMETQLGAGLIEEVIQVAEGELKLTDLLARSQPWEELEEKPAEGQWKYFERGTATGQTQEP